MNRSQKASVFTLDTEGGNPVEMPSVTKLLNRKKLGISVTLNTQTTLTPPPVHSATVQCIKPRKRHHEPQPLAQWDLALLKSATDPFQKGVLYLLEKGAQQALLLTPPTPSSPDISCFVSTCAYMAGKREELWRGISLTPELIPDIWQKLFTQGFYEVVTTNPVCLEQPEDSASFVKNTFGLSPEEFFIIVRCGSPASCTGLLALVSHFSLLKEIATAFSAPQASTQTPPKKVA